MNKKIYRVKIPKCLDIIVYGEVKDILLLLNYVMKHDICDKDSKLYIHVLRRYGNELIDEKLILSTHLNEFREDMLSSHDQP